MARKGKPKKIRPRRPMPRGKLKKPSTFERRAWKLVGLRPDVGLSPFEDHVLVRPHGKPAIVVTEEYTELREATPAERSKVDVSDAIGGESEVLRIPAGHRKEAELVAARLGPAPRHRPTRTVVDGFGKRERERRERERRARSRRDTAMAALQKSGPILRAAGIDVSGAAGRLVIRDGVFAIDDTKRDGTLELISRYVPPIRFTGLETCFDRPNAAEVALAVQPATRMGGAIHAPVGSAPWVSILSMRAASAAREHAAAKERRKAEQRLRRAQADGARRSRDAEAAKRREQAPALVASLGGELRTHGVPVEFANDRLYVDNVAVGELAINPEPHVRVFGGRGLVVGAASVTPTDLSDDERAALTTRPETERRSVLLDIVGGRLREARHHVLREVLPARELLAALEVEPRQDRDGLYVGSELVLPFGVPVALRELRHRYCAGLLLKTASQVMKSRAPGLSLSRAGDGAVEILSDGLVFARVEANVAVIVAETRGQRLSGNFVDNEADWIRLLGLMHATFPTLAIDGFDILQVVVIRDVPDGLPPGLTLRCMEASRAIRTRRNVAYGNAVTFTTAGATTVTFFPIQNDGTPYVPVRCHLRDKTVRCDLQLAGEGDPLPLTVRDTTKDLAGVWALTLLGFATLAVVPEDASREPRPRGAPRTRGGSSRTRPTFRGGAAPSGRPRHLSLDLEPTGATRTAHWVVGHVRWLGAGRSHTPDAAREASKHGIHLRQNQTWVRPHVRGLSPGAPLTFRWRLPHEALSLVP